MGAGKGKNKRAQLKLRKSFLDKNQALVEQGFRSYGDLRRDGEDRIGYTLLTNDAKWGRLDPTKFRTVTIAFGGLSYDESFPIMGAGKSRNIPISKGNDQKQIYIEDSVHLPTKTLSRYIDIGNDLNEAVEKANKCIEEAIEYTEVNDDSRLQLRDPNFRFTKNNLKKSFEDFIEFEARASLKKEMTSEERKIIEKVIHEEQRTVNELVDKRANEIKRSLNIEDIL